uniref:Uncharacterized protein n=1 Tax=Knipowitschia caucasica TaxID=637954 RepID=A0AAV2JH08_KNICA
MWCGRGQPLLPAPVVVSGQPPAPAPVGSEVQPCPALWVKGQSQPCPAPVGQSVSPCHSSCGVRGQPLPRSVYGSEVQPAPDSVGSVVSPCPSSCGVRRVSPCTAPCRGWLSAMNSSTSRVTMDTGLYATKGPLTHAGRPDRAAGPPAWPLLLLRGFFPSVGDVTPEITDVAVFLEEMLNECSGELGPNMDPELTPDPQELSYLVLRVIGIMGRAVQDHNPRLVSAVLHCAKKTNAPLLTQKAAIQAFRNINNEV